jgi:hypothetical protein
MIFFPFFWVFLMAVCHVSSVMPRKVFVMSG